MTPLARYIGETGVPPRPAVYIRGREVRRKLLACKELTSSYLAMPRPSKRPCRAAASSRSPSPPMFPYLYRRAGRAAPAAPPAAPPPVPAAPARRR